MQSTGQTGTHLPQPEQSSGTMITSMPWLKMAPNWGGQCRMHVSQLMHSDISTRRAGSFHFGLRSRASNRSSRVDAGIAFRLLMCPSDERRKRSAVAKYPFLSEEWITAVGKIGA